jgi:ATP-binding protein involved in chromosome partitioning
MREIPVPLEIGRAAPGQLRIRWDEGHEGIYATRSLRLACPCAQCQEEMSGRPLLDPASVPLDVEALQLSLVGGYAVRFDWSDGHHTGIYTYELLFDLCPCASCAARRAEAEPRGGPNRRA